MTLNASMLASRFAIMPGREAVTYYVLSDFDVFEDPVTLYDVEAGSITGPASQATSETNQNTIIFPDASGTFHFWATKVGSIIPKAGDKIVAADGSAWIATSIGFGMLGQRYSVTCDLAKGT